MEGDSVKAECVSCGRIWQSSWSGIKQGRCAVCGDRLEVAKDSDARIIAEEHAKGEKQEKAGERQPAKICAKAVAIILHNMAIAVEAGDSFGGSVEYELADDGNYNILGVYRTGNRYGQGFLKLIGMPDPNECAFKEPLKAARPAEREAERKYPTIDLIKINDEWLAKSTPITCPSCYPHGVVWIKCKVCNGTGDVVEREAEPCAHLSTDFNRTQCLQCGTLLVPAAVKEVVDGAVKLLPSPAPADIARLVELPQIIRKKLNHHIDDSEDCGQSCIYPLLDELDRALPALLAQLETMEEQLRLVAEGTPRVLDDFHKLKMERDALLAERESVGKDFETYGEHKPSCLVHDENSIVGVQQTCTCGFRDALARLKAKE